MDKGIIESVNEKSQYIIEKIKVLKDKYDIIEGVQGKGLLLGLKVKTDPKKILDKCFENKLMLISAGKDVIRILPPLNVTKEEIDAAIDILDKSLQEILV